MHTSRSRRFLSGLTLCVGWLLFASTALANPPVGLQQETGRGLALGSGMRASAISTAALAYNPAALASGRLYHLDGYADYSPNTDTLILGGAIVDSLTSSLAAGMSARAMLAQGNTAPDGFDIRLGAALPISNAVSIGLSGRYLNITGAKALRGADNVDPSTKGITLDASLSITPMDGVRLAFLGYNLVNRHSLYVPVMGGGSIAVNVGDSLTIGGDFLADFTTFSRTTFIGGGGLEYVHNTTIPLRLGYLFDSGRNTHYLGAGIGYNEQKMGVEVGLQQGVSGTNDTRVVASLRYFVQ